MAFYPFNDHPIIVAIRLTFMAIGIFGLAMMAFFLL